MKKPFKIGVREYKYKKDAIIHYRSVLNSYDFGDSLSDSDFDDLLDLLNFDYLNYLAEIDHISEEDVTDMKPEDDISEDEYYIIDIKVSQVQFNTKCFEVFYNNGTSCYISYLMIINNRQYNPEKLFDKACRNSIQDDLRSVKQSFFDKYSLKGQVKCQESGQLSKWSELSVDHRQPNTFSVIVDRYKEINKFNFDEIEYLTNEKNLLLFKDETLIQDFINYHKEKANLRIVRKEFNLGRASLARIKKMSKDLSIE